MGVADKLKDLQLEETLEDQPEPHAPEKSALFKRAADAQLMEQIHKADLAGYKVEKEKVALETLAGHLIETDFAEFLFLSYLEKANVDLLGMMKRLEPIIVNLVKEGDHKKLMRRIDKEIQSILIDIKKNQKKDALSWKRGLS